MLLELIQTVEDTAASSGIVTVLVDNLSKAIARVITVSMLNIVLVYVSYCIIGTARIVYRMCIRVCVMVRCPLHLCPIYQPLQQRAVGLLLWAQRRAISMDLCTAHLYNTIQYKICQAMRPPAADWLFP